ncbi:nucleotide exchange factor GrpE [Haloglomus halophilum]|uniref:nucleotide exchange factor GrpE n=1 Tax=Haloglomus halophilum TaxID=2962672 RepID=UPI0020C966D3|nr:nucleotide exchange factor GrpE [Haloglomus halophilum]
MTDSSRGGPRPLGVDLGSATTTGTVVEAGTPRLLEVDGQSALPTRFAVTTEAGIVVGEDATTTDGDGMTPLPYLDDGPTGTTPDDLPLPVFFGELRRTWMASLNDGRPVTDGGEDRDGGIDDIEGVERVDTDETADDEDESDADAPDADAGDAGDDTETDADDDAAAADTADEDRDADTDEGTAVKTRTDAEAAAEADDGADDEPATDDATDTADAETGTGTEDADESGTEASVDAGADRSDADSVPADDADVESGTDEEESDPATEDTTETAPAGAFGPTTITVPGPYAASDLAAVESAAEAAGFGDPLAVRAPVAVAATELPDCEDERTVAVADIGANWGSFAVVTVRPDGELSVAARTSLTDHGRAALDDTLATWLVDRVGRDHGVTFRLDDGARARVREAAHEALDTVASGDDGAATIDLELSEGVEVVEGGVFGADALSPTIELTMDDCFDALADHLRAIQGSIDDLLRAAAVDDIDTLLLTGDGTRPAPVLFAVENAFDQRSQPPAEGDRYTAASVGAALLASARAGSDDPVVDETYDRDVELHALGESGPEARRLDAPGTGPGRPCRTELVPASETQLSGVFELQLRHRITGEREHAGTYVCSGLPSGADEGRLTVSFDAPAARLDAANAGDAVTVEPVADEAAPEADASATDGGAVPDRAGEFTFARDDEAGAPWLAHADIDRAALPASERGGDDGQPGLDARSDTERALAAVDEESVARAAWKLRNKLWKQGVRKGDGIPGDDLQLLFRELDQNLSMASVEIIEPELGSMFDDQRHWVVEARETDEPAETILEVKSLGVAVDGNVLEQAEVTVAK